MRREKAFHQELFRWQAYQKWFKERNPARREMEAKFGYDTRHAMHLVRLIRMAKEIMAVGEVIVFRPDREELMAIRNGAWSYDDLVKYASDVDAELDELYQKSTLRNKPNHKTISELYVSICEAHYGIKVGVSNA